MLGQIGIADHRADADVAVGVAAAAMLAVAANATEEIWPGGSAIEVCAWAVTAPKVANIQASRRPDMREVPCDT